MQKACDGQCVSGRIDCGGTCYQEKIGGNVQQQESAFQNHSNVTENVLEIISIAAMDCALPIKEIVKVQLEYNN